MIKLCSFGILIFLCHFMSLHGSKRNLAGGRTAVRQALSQAAGQAVRSNGCVRDTWRCAESRFLEKTLSLSGLERFEKWTSKSWSLRRCPMDKPGRKIENGNHKIEKSVKSQTFAKHLLSTVAHGVWGFPQLLRQKNWLRLPKRVALSPS